MSLCMQAFATLNCAPAFYKLGEAVLGIFVSTEKSRVYTFWVWKAVFLKGWFSVGRVRRPSPWNLDGIRCCREKNFCGFRRNVLWRSSLVGMCLNAMWVLLRHWNKSYLYNLRLYWKDCLPFSLIIASRHNRVLTGAMTPIQEATKPPRGSVS